MLRSMTAYGRASQKFEDGYFTIEIQSVNRKHLEVNVQIPPELAQFEMDIKKWIAHTVSRGSVTIKVFAYFETSTPFVVKPNIALAQQFKNAWDQISEHLQLSKKEFDLRLLSTVEDIMVIEDRKDNEELYRKHLKEVLELALKDFLHLKKQEGYLLQADISARLRKMHDWIVQIEIKAPDAVLKHRSKLISRLEEVLPGKIENEEKILREIAVYAEKIDIAEEIIRFKCHLTRFEELMLGESSMVGKTLDFIIQELNREINTISSKSNDMHISVLAIDIKSELERIREQIQNVE